MGKSVANMATAAENVDLGVLQFSPSRAAHLGSQKVRAKRL